MFLRVCTGETTNIHWFFKFTDRPQSFLQFDPASPRMSHIRIRVFNVRDHGPHGRG